MILAAVHLSPSVTIPPALALLAVLIWYWLRLGRADVPMSRRKIRRASVTLAVLAVPTLVAGFSFVDGDVEPRRYLVVWATAVLLLMLIVVTAVLDVINNLRIHARWQEEDAVRAAGELLAAIEARKQATASGPRVNTPRNKSDSPAEEPGS